MKQFCVYILECNDGSFYTGMSSDINARLQKHNSGYYPDCYTFNRRPFKLVYYQEFPDFNQTMLFEKQVKGWSRKKKQALIDSRWDDLKRFSRNYTEYGKPEE